MMMILCTHGRIPNPAHVKDWMLEWAQWNGSDAVSLRDFGLRAREQNGRLGRAFVLNKYAASGHSTPAPRLTQPLHHLRQYSLQKGRKG